MEYYFTTTEDVRAQIWHVEFLFVLRELWYLSRFELIFGRCMTRKRKGSKFFEKCL